MRKNLIDKLLHSTLGTASHCGDRSARFKKCDSRSEPDGQAIGIGYYYAVWLGRKL